ncbi:DUF7619 domain-containing protein [Flavobacterium rhizosphaerae]|uniref:T9SS type A sorting domain-containing protein n=1 Tax=Flavobacterium rhizosphaerae TaxID=3163298 RepID=A0ABW8Z2H6_9FLAO
MKKKFLLLSIFLITICSNAQIINIPDANFKAKLLQGGGYPLYYAVTKDVNGQSILVDSNNDGEIQEAEALQVYEMNIIDSNVASLEGIQYFTNLTTLRCSENQLITLNVSMLSNLMYFDCSVNQLTTINIPGNLTTYNFSGNLITSIDYASLTNVQHFYCDSNLLTSLNAQSFPNINTLSCSNNPLTELDLSGLSNLQYAIIANVELTSLNLTGLLSLEYIEISDSLLEHIDFSNCPALFYFHVYDNPNLVSVNIKNGDTMLAPQECYVVNNPLLESICIDEGEEVILAENDDFDNITLTTDCESTIIPYNTITGHISFDLNADGCDENDGAAYFAKVELTDGTVTRYQYVNYQGDYSFLTEDGSFTVTPVFEQPLFTYSPTDAQVNFTAIDGSVATEDFCLMADGDHPDVEIIITPMSTATPGFDAIYRIICRNKGNQPLSGTFTFTFDDSLLTFDQATVTPDAVNAGELTWNYSLMPFGYEIVMVSLPVNTPNDTPPVNIDDVLSFTATINPVTGDDTPDDNVFTFEHVVVGSYDPNNIICLQGDTEPVERIGEYLHYTINFENIGTAAAQFVTVTDEIDATKYDVSTLQVLNSSDAVSATLEGNIITFRFDDINLAPEAHGNVTFKIKSLSSLQAGDAVMNQASIVFDYNEAIVTNEAVTTYETTADIKDVVTANVSLYPNPTKNVVTVEASQTISSVRIFDVQGRQLSIEKGGATSAQINMQPYPNGVYLVKVTTDKGTSSHKIIKQ